MKRFDGKSALITGAARGIGRGFAEVYLAEGATVAIADIDPDAAKQTASELGGAAYAVQIDVSDEDSIDASCGAVISQAGRRSESLVLVYCSTKVAVISMTQSACLNLIKHGINVNAIAPGVVDGEHWEHVDAIIAKLEVKKPGQKKAEVAAFVPVGRFAVPADLTGMAVFLASPESDYILSQAYNVDGNQWMS
jgi:NAD(P)-dependent dehydrogenase (short-subunit alcohol dehydrogenase family)